MRYRIFFVLFLFSFFALTASAQAAPAMPTNLSASYAIVSNYGIVYLYWTDNATDEAEFRLYRKLSTDSSWPIVYSNNHSYLTKYGAKSGTGATQSNDPNVNLPTGTYEYKMAACDSLGVCSGFSNVASVVVGTSSPNPDTTPPSMPSGFTANSVSTSQVNLSWGLSTDNMGVSGYKMYRNSAHLATLSSGAVSYSDTSVYSGMTYSYYIIAYDAAGNYSSPSPTISVAVSYDTTPPTAPLNLIASNPSPSQIQLSWGASTDNVGVSQYAIYRNSSYLVSVSLGACCNYTDSSVTSGGTYTYYVTAYDARGNISSPSNTVTITASSSNNTDTTNDTTAPSWPSGHTYGSIILSSTSIRVNWSSATDNVGIMGYKIYRNGTQITTTTLLEYTDSGLAPATAYSYSVSAYDAAGNVSTMQINVSSVTTWSDTSNDMTTPTTDTTVPAISNIRAENIIGSGAQIKWSTDDAANSRVFYGLSSGNLVYLADDRCDSSGYVTSHCVNLTGLVASAVYYYKVKSLNESGLDSESAVYQFTSASAITADTAAPTPPNAVSSYAVSASSISISWSGATDDVGVTGYKIYRNGTFLSITTGLSYIDSGLSPSTSYSYTIATYDAAGNLSGTSASTNATTMANTDANTTIVSYANISGKVTNSTGAAVAGANVYLSSSDRYYSAVTDTSGLYSLASVYPASYSVKVYGPSGSAYQSVSKTVTLTAGQIIALNLQFAVSSKVIKGKISYLDGRLVVNAGIGAYNSVSGAWTNGYVDSSGVFALQVSGGKWQVNIYPKPTNMTQTSDWSHMEPPREASFIDDASTEEAIVNFTVKGAPVAVRGYVFLPDGNAPMTGTVSVSLRGSSGFEHRPSVDSSGMFFMYLPADTYNGEIFSTDARYGGVEIAAFSAVSGTVDLGRFYLKTKSEKIKGTVKDSSGNPIAGIWVNANQYASGKFAQAKSLENGSYEIAVSAGEWSVQAYSDPMLGYSYNQPPKYVTVPVGGTAEANFVLTKSDAQISGNIVDASGQTVTDAQGYISTYVPSTGMTMYYGSQSFGGQIEKGSFSFKLPAGTYTLSVNFPPDSGYIPPEPQSVVVASGETKKVNIAIAKTDVALSGFLRDDAGVIIKGLGNDKVKVYLSAKGGAWHNAKIDSSTGAFSAQISAGTWYLGYWAESSSGYVSSGKDIKIVAAAGESKKIDITLLKANSVISGAVKTSEGTVLPNVWVSVNTRSFSAMTGGSTGAVSGSSYVGGASSDQTGKFDIKVPPGRYFVQSSYQMTSGYLNPSEIEVAVESGKAASVEIVFKKPDATLSGIAFIDGKGASAFVWAWRESGGYASVRADESGKYSFAVSRNSKWRAAASYERNGVYYKSAEIAVEIGDQASLTQDLTLLSLNTVLPTAVEKVVETVKPQSVELQNGAKVVVPANALATSGSANIAMKPDVEVPSIGSTSIVGAGYKVEAKDEKGQDITNLNAEITISIPYDEADLAAKGLKPEDLTLSFFDETTQTWKAVEKQVVDKETKAVLGMVSHLTLFALVAPADTAPPSAPSGISASLKDGAVVLNWKNPSADFHHVKIYRSSQKAVLGTAAFNYITGESKSDSSGNASYFYTIRAVDLAGNESGNTAQYQAGGSAVPEGATVPTTVAVPSAQSGILLVRAGGDPRVYVVENGKKHWVKSPEEFNAGGYKWSDIKLIGAAQLAGYADQGASFQFLATLRIGSRGEAVRQLQALLARDKAIYPQGLATGYYGSLTRVAVIRFQAKHKIRQTGIVGVETRKKLNELSAS